MFSQKSNAVFHSHSCLKMLMKAAISSCNTDFLNGQFFLQNTQIAKTSSPRESRQSSSDGCENGSKWTKPRTDRIITPNVIPAEPTPLKGPPPVKKSHEVVPNNFKVPSSTTKRSAVQRSSSVGPVKRDAAALSKMSSFFSHCDQNPFEN